jgi:hypothetical protein
MKLSLCQHYDRHWHFKRTEVIPVSALWHRHWHFKTTDKVIPVYQHYDTDIDTSRQQKKLPLCVSIMTDIHTSRQQKKLPLCVSIMTQTLTLQDNKWSYPCVSALWHRLWHFKTTNEVIPVCQHYDTDFDTSRQQMKSFLYVSIMTQTLTLQEKRWSYPCVSALWHRHWYFKTTNEVVPVCQHYDTDIDTSRQHRKLSLCQHYNTDTDTSRKQMKLSMCQHYDTYIDTSKQ